MNEAQAMLWGLGVTLVFGAGVGDLLDAIENKVQKKWGGQVPSPIGYPEEEWAVQVITSSPGGAVLGWLERTIYFSSISVSGAWVLAGAWLGFRVACKWKSWELGDLPSRTGSADDVWLPDARARLYRTESAHRRFVIGQAANLVAALAGAGAGKLFAALL